MFKAGVARTRLTPFWGVELTGWGYYIERKWQRIHDHLNASALAIENGEGSAILLALDLMVIDEPFTRRTRERIGEVTGLPPEAILLNCSHTHNAPSAGGLRGAGECDPAYEDWASRQAATAAILAWRSREPAAARAGHSTVSDLSFNRTRVGGVIDSRLTALRIDRSDGSPMVIVTNFGAHPTVATELRPWDVSRDVPGLVCDGLEEAYPGSMAMYLQGACGDVNFVREFTAPERWKEPGHRLIEATKVALGTAETMENPVVSAASERIALTTRRWQLEEIESDRREAQRRLEERDISGWRETIGRSMTNRPDDMVRRHGGDERKAVETMCRFHMEWTGLVLRDFATRPETLNTEVQALRIGDLYCVANSSEFFTSFALDVRTRAHVPEVMLACYSNGRIGYLPDEHDIAARSYAGYQSPKYCNQFPFTPASGPEMCEAMLRVVDFCRDRA